MIFTVSSLYLLFEMPMHSHRPKWELSEEGNGEGGGEEGRRRKKKEEGWGDTILETKIQLQGFTFSGSAMEKNCNTGKDGKWLNWNL